MGVVDQAATGMVEIGSFVKLLRSRDDDRHAMLCRKPLPVLSRSPVAAASHRCTIDGTNLLRSLLALVAAAAATSAGSTATPASVRALLIVAALLVDALFNTRDGPCLLSTQALNLLIAACAALLRHSVLVDGGDARFAAAAASAWEALGATVRMLCADGASHLVAAGLVELLLEGCTSAAPRLLVALALDALLGVADCQPLLERMHCLGGIRVLCEMLGRASSSHAPNGASPNSKSTAAALAWAPCAQDAWDTMPDGIPYRVGYEIDDDGGVGLGGLARFSAIGLRCVPAARAAALRCLWSRWHGVCCSRRRVCNAATARAAGGRRARRKLDASSDDRHGHSCAGAIPPQRRRRGAALEHCTALRCGAHPVRA
jgi:hypothetical protein